MILVDTCILLDVVQNDSEWADWSQAQMEWASEHGGMLINPIIYSEFSVYYDQMATMDRTLSELSITLKPLPREALFLAGKAFLQYRSRRGTRTSLLPDFFIGAHAAVQELPVLTRDVARIKSYFPTVALLSPR